MRIRLDNLPKEYQKKLCERTLTQETIYSLTFSISQKYRKQKQLLIRVAILRVILTLVMAAASFISPAAARGNRIVILGSCAVALILELLIIAGIYYIAVTRVPRQFSRCLAKGYPELTSFYSYEAILSGQLEASGQSRQLPFSLYIEDVFHLDDSHDVIVSGFAHGLITRNQSVYIIDPKDPAKGKYAAIVTQIETGPGQPAQQAADCPSALRLQNGQDFPICPGMYLYRDNF